MAFTLTKGYLENHQEVFQRYLVKEIEELTLRDVRYQTKIDKGRLTALMSNVQLSDINLEQAHFTIDFISNSGMVAQSENSNQCDTDFVIQLGVTGISMVFDFNVWIEVESSHVLEEQSMGSFQMTNMNFTLVAQPYVYQEKFRLKNLDKNFNYELKIGDYKYQLHTAEESQFEATLE